LRHHSALSTPPGLASGSLPVHPKRVMLQDRFDDATGREICFSADAMDRSALHRQTLFDSGERREDRSFATWMAMDFGYLLGQLGISGPYWCATNLRRSEVFNDAGCGDIDALFGALQGRCWQGATDFVAACEVKTSKFDGDRGLKRTLQTQGHKIVEQLRLLVDRGIDRTGFLHLIIANPREVPGAGRWSVSDYDSIAAVEAARKRLFDPSTLPGCGYFRTSIAALPGVPEYIEGGAGWFDVVEYATDHPSARAPQPWRDTVQSLLESLGDPEFAPCFIRRCDTCGRLYQHPSSIGGHREVERDPRFNCRNGPR
jgi:hypothetical protein